MHAARLYPAMKASGVEWLGDVPAHWNVFPNRAVYVEVNDPGYSNEQLLSVTISSGVLRQDELLEETSKKDQSRIDKSAYKLVQPGDVAYNRMRAWQGAIGASRLRGIISPAYIVQRPLDPANADYMHHLFRTPAFAKEAERRSYGITSDMWSLRPQDFKTIYVCVPPLSEQHAIVRFVDYADRRIRRHIRAKEKLIALLEEQKQIAIHQAVTGQIDVRTGQPYPAYKPSGAEWLGEVPAEWQVVRLGRVISLTAGYPFKSDNFTRFESDVRLLRGINVAPGRLRWDEVVRWSVADIDAYSEYQVGVGDIILGMDRPIIGGGIRVAMADENDVPSLLLQRVARIRPVKERLDREFALRILSSRNFLNYLSPIFTGISVPHLSPEQIREFWIALPSITEQRAIVEYLTSRVKDVQFAAERAGRQVDLLREYRTRLIADVVTGKFDVREAAATLPEEPDDPDAMEADFAGAEGRDDSRPDRDRRTTVPARKEEMAP